MYAKGDRVLVRGVGGKEAVLIVWESRRKGLMLCTEEGFQANLRGEEAPVVGFPFCDIKGLYGEEKEGRQTQGHDPIATPAQV